MMRRGRGGWCRALPAGLLATVLLAPSPGPRDAEERSLSIRLEPHRDTDQCDGIGSVSVSLEFSDLNVKAGAPAFEIPLVTSNVDTVATTLRRLVISDRRGTIPFRVRDGDRPEVGVGDALGGGTSRQWVLERDSSGPVRVQYVIAAMDSLSPRGPAPPIGLRNDDAAVSGSGSVFLLLPPGPERYRTDVRWNLAELPGTARAVSSLGAGTPRSAASLTNDELRSLFFMAGQIRTWTGDEAAPDFFLAWQGQPVFDVPKLAAWSGSLHERFRSFFGQQEQAPYGVFLRYNPVNAGGGVGHHQSFVITYGAGAGSDVEAMRITLSHEMFHTFQPFIDGGLISSWFGEGLAVFYQARLPARFGLITPDAFLADLNETAARYYTSTMASLPNNAIPDLFWKDTRARTLPYDRGMLYFATVDHAVRKSSNGTRSLDDLMLQMRARGKAQGTLSNADWEALLLADLGPKAVTEFREFLGGRMPIPASDAFGPCFKATSRSLQRYELGFEPSTLAEPRRVVRGLVAGSAADRAGLRNGDVILKPVPQDAIQGDQQALLTLLVDRGDGPLSIAYRPRGETVEARQWMRIPGIKDDACGL